MREVYLDNSATTQVCRQAAEKMQEICLNTYANPSSLHKKGLEAELELIRARKIIAKRLFCDEREIYFTSGGTEANNLAILGAARRRKKFGNKIVTTAVEHPSVAECARHLEREGFEVVLLSPDENGNFSLEEIANAIDQRTVLVSMMMINNELGWCLPVDKLKKILGRKNSPALIHIDAVQAFGKTDVKPQKLGADFLSISAHKIHGPKGVGALYVKNPATLSPLFFGGEQEKRLRPGTEPLPLIAGFGAAVEQLGTIALENAKIVELWGECEAAFSEIPGVQINSKRAGSPYIFNFSVPGIRSETMLHFLAEKGIFVSSGSACSKGKKSHVLAAANFSDPRIDSAIRVSFSKFNTKDDVHALIQAVKAGIGALARR